MAHRLTEEELARFHDAFRNWDINGAGEISARDLCMVMEALGEVPSSMLRKLCARPDAEHERVNFDEFLSITVGPPWEATGPDPEQELKEAMEDFDDGNGYIPLRDLMRIVHQHLEEGGYHLTDGDLVGVYRQAFDGSFFAAAGGKLSPENLWNVFEEEFKQFRKIQRTENAHSAAAGEASHRCCDVLARLRLVHMGPVMCFRRLWSRPACRSSDSAARKDRAGDDCDATGETAHMLDLTVVDLAGKQLMFDAVASTLSVQALQQHIETVVGVPVHRQLLCFEKDDGFSQELCPNDVCLSHAGVVDGSSLLLVVKGEIKLDYKKFVSRFMDLDFGPPTARAQILGRRI